MIAWKINNIDVIFHLAGWSCYHLNDTICFSKNVPHSHKTAKSAWDIALEHCWCYPPLVKGTSADHDWECHVFHFACCGMRGWKKLRQKEIIIIRLSFSFTSVNILEPIYLSLRKIRPAKMAVRKEGQEKQHAHRSSTKKRGRGGGLEKMAKGRQYCSK